MPDDEKNSLLFAKIYQGSLTNLFSKLITSDKAFKRHIFTLNKITQVASFETSFQDGDLLVQIEHFDELKGFRVSTQQLLDILLIQLVESGANDLEVKLPLSRLMEIRGLKDKKETRKQVIEDLNTLYHVNIFISGTSGKNFRDLRIMSDKGIINSVIHVTFGPRFFELIKSMNIMPLPLHFYKTNNNQHPNSYFLGRRIAEHKNMNYGKSNADLISVKTLLDSAPYLPIKEEVSVHNSSYVARIIVPFERDMNALAPVFQWEYCSKSKTTVSEDELDHLSYEDFEQLIIHISWQTYPIRKKRIPCR